MVQTRFEWNLQKDRENQAKHGVAFAAAQYAFGDPHRVIAEDVSHSAGEKRYYCFGKVADGILTVRFTYRKGVIRIIGAGYWRKGKKIYEETNKIYG
jgi:uncharacterized DUF497 family protein